MQTVCGSYGVKLDTDYDFIVLSTTSEYSINLLSDNSTTPGDFDQIWLDVTLK